MGAVHPSPSNFKAACGAASPPRPIAAAKTPRTSTSAEDELANRTVFFISVFNSPGALHHGGLHTMDRRKRVEQALPPLAAVDAPAEWARSGVGMRTVIVMALAIGPANVSWEGIEQTNLEAREQIPTHARVLLTGNCSFDPA